MSEKNSSTIATVATVVSTTAIIGVNAYCMYQAWKARRILKDMAETEELRLKITEDVVESLTNKKSAN